MYKILNSDSNVKKLINSSNNYLKYLKSKKYKKQKIFEKYISNIKTFISFKSQNNNKLQILKNIELHEYLLNFEKDKIFENCDHDKNFCKKFYLLSYFIFNIFQKIWKNEKILEKDVKNLPVKNRVFIAKVISQKFGRILNLDNISDFLKDLNSLKNFDFFKRKEELIKFLSRNFLKYLNDVFTFVKLRRIFYENFEKKIFNFYFYIKNKRIYVKKFNPEIRFQFLKIEIFKKKFFEFKSFLKKKKKDIIDIFFFKLMKKKEKNFQMFKNYLKNTSNDNNVYKTKDQNLIDIKYPWTIAQINLSFQLFESKSEK